ncbi:MAG: DUF374 domain-containing protein [Deltaproteobacteria bacterium]|nr:DUF374 domain-containing protein [Deltaproteobacteria bacterium]
MKKKLLDTIGVRVMPFAAFWIIRCLAATMRFSFVNSEWVRERARNGQNSIYAFWHGRLMMMPFSYEGPGVTILVSGSRDGELVSRTVARFGIASVRGSTSRGWMQGLKGILRSVRSGRDIAITPDGPKGPRFRAQMGAVQVARATGLPIVPMSFGASKKKPFQAGTPSSCRCRFPAGSSYTASLLA